MPYPILDRTRISIKSLAERESDMDLRNLLNVDTTAPAIPADKKEMLERVAERILQAKKNKKSIILSYGAHLVKNGLGPILNQFIEKKLVTHLATNGAGTIHDWELAYLGRSTESVRRYVGEGQFGIWDETGRYMNLALMLGAAEGKGYGESLGEMIETEKLLLPSLNSLKEELQKELKDNKFGNETFGMRSELLAYLTRFGMKPGVIDLPHPNKVLSVLRTAFIHQVPLCVMPGIGYDIIYTHFLNNGAAIGHTAVRDFLTFTQAQLNLDGGIYLSVGSAIMSPMTFEKARSMARNIARQEGRSLDDTYIIVNDIQPAGEDWKIEPTKESPAYYLRFLKTYRRMHGHFEYVELDNREFLLNLLNLLG